MKTIDLEIARRKTPVIANLLDGLAHVPAIAPGLQSYHAAKAAVNGNLRTGVDRRCRAVKKALKQFNVIVSVAGNSRGIPAVRVFSPIKQTEIFL
jgi:hypothetical protein